MLNNQRVDSILKHIEVPQTGLIVLNVFRKAISIKPELIITQKFLLDYINYMKECVSFTDQVCVFEFFYKILK